MKMKKYIFLIMVSMAFPFISRACDICGCGVGNSYIGILPEFRKHIFGVRYRYNAMLTHLGVDGTFTYLTTKENYQTIELWGGWNIGDKARIMMSIPYVFNERTNQGVSTNKNGIGDISLSGYYQLLNDRHTVMKSKLLVQSLWIGGGIKLATGKYNPSDKNTTNNNANLFQLGTGSFDFNIVAMYDVRLQDAGINIAANYKINTPNKYAYQYGNKFSVNTQAYYKIRIKDKLTIAPNAGILYETAQNYFDNGYKTTVSGGQLLLGTAGMEVSFGKWAVGANFQTPLSQNLANGIVMAKDRAMVHVAIAL